MHDPDLTDLKCELKKYTGFKIWSKHGFIQWHNDVFPWQYFMRIFWAQEMMFLWPVTTLRLYSCQLRAHHFKWLSMCVILHSPTLDFWYWIFSLIMSRYNSSQSFLLLLPNKFILMNFAVWLHSQERHEYIEQHTLQHWLLQNSTPSSTSLHCEKLWFIRVLRILSSKQLQRYTRAFPPVVFSA